MTQLRILFLAWRGPGHPEAGGSEAYVHNIGQELVRLGHEVTVRTAAHPCAPRREVIDGVTVDRRGRRLSVYPWGLLHLLSRRARAADVVVDVINGLPFGAPLVRRRGVVGLVHHVHRRQWQMIYPGPRGRIGWFIESHLVPVLYGNSLVITVSQATRSDLVAMGLSAERTVIVRNGLRARPCHTPRSATPRVVVLARLVPHKQIEHALEAIASCRQEHPQATLDVIGEGWWRPNLEAMVRDLKIEDAVTFHGHVSDAIRDELLAQAWLMVLPSIKEGWGIAVTEAAVQGTPTVGYRSSGGLSESITDGVTGWLVDSPRELLRTVASVLHDREEVDRRGEAAQRAASQLNWGTSAAAFAAVVAERVSGRRR